MSSSTEWARGYPVHEPYPPSWHSFQSPAHLRAICALMGVAWEVGPETSLSIAEVGCGTGYTGSVLAAGNPNSRVSGARLQSGPHRGSPKHGIRRRAREHPVPRRRSRGTRRRRTRPPSGVRSDHRARRLVMGFGCRSRRHLAADPYAAEAWRDCHDLVQCVAGRRLGSRIVAPGARRHDATPTTTLTGSTPPSKLVQRLVSAEAAHLPSSVWRRIVTREQAARPDYVRARIHDRPLASRASSPTWLRRFPRRVATSSGSATIDENFPEMSLTAEQAALWNEAPNMASRQLIFDMCVATSIPSRRLRSRATAGCPRSDNRRHLDDADVP